METFNVYLLQRNLRCKMEVQIDFLTVVSHKLMSWSDRLGLVNSINPVYYTLLIYLLTVWQENLVIISWFFFSLNEIFRDFPNSILTSSAFIM